MNKVYLALIVNLIFDASLCFADSQQVAKEKYGQYNTIKLVHSAISEDVIPVIAKNLELPDRKISKLVKSFGESKKRVAKRTLNFIDNRHLSFFHVKEVLSGKKIPKKIYVIFPDANNTTYLQPTHYDANEEDLFNRPRFDDQTGSNWLLFLEPIDVINAELPKKLKKSKFFKKRQLYQIYSESTAFRLGENLEKNHWDEKIFSVDLRKDIKDIYRLKKSGTPLTASLNTMKTGFAKKIFNSFVTESQHGESVKDNKFEQIKATLLSK